MHREDTAKVNPKFIVVPEQVLEEKGASDTNFLPTNEGTDGKFPEALIQITKSSTVQLSDYYVWNALEKYSLENSIWAFSSVPFRMQKASGK